MGSANVSIQTELIFCYAGNKRLAEIAIANGFKYGAQMPGTAYFSPYFVDQNWKNPNREGYMAALRAHQPHIATVIDWEYLSQLDEVLVWAEEAAQYTDVVVVIPKVPHGIDRIPDAIGGKSVRLGYSVPTRYGGTSTPLWEFGNRPVHLLGGSPNKQFALASYLNVVSMDNNMIAKMAVQRCQFYSNTPVPCCKNKWFPALGEVGIYPVADAYPVAFDLSCKNVAKLWREE